MADQSPASVSRWHTKGKHQSLPSPVSVPRIRRVSSSDMQHQFPLSMKEIGNNIKVAARIRPRNDMEEVRNRQQLEEGKVEAIQCVSPTSILIGETKEIVTFDFVFSPESSQQLVFEKIGLPMVEDVLRGYNSTIFTYGQTGAGKTYSMMGTDIYDEKHRGIIPRVASELFSRIESFDTDAEFTFKCSMVEIYKERLNDLLNTEEVPLRIKEDPHKGIYVEGLKQVCVADEAELIEVIYLGEQMRTVAATKWNAVSSRSHQIFILEVKQSLPNDTEKRGILNLVDLAGSEKVTCYGVTGNTLQETKKINLSLSALGNVIHALTNNSDHIPYRDSKLTRLLQESLGGNFKTAVLVALSPSLRVLDETINSVKFAQRAKRIKNRARVNIKESTDLYLATIARLRKELAQALQELSWYKAQFGSGITMPETPQAITSYPSSISSPYDLTRNASLPASASPRKSRQDSSQNPMVINFDLADECSSVGSPVVDKQTELELSQSFVRSKTRSISILEQPDSSPRSDEIARITNLYEDQLRGKNHKIEKLESLLEALRAQGKELDRQLQSARVKLAKAEGVAHNYLQQFEQLNLKSVSSVQEIEHLRTKNKSAKLLIKDLQQNLTNMEAKCSEMATIKTGWKDPTLLEFTEYKEVGKEKAPTEEPEREGEETNSMNFAYEATKKPLGLLAVSEYTERLQQALTTNSYLSHEVSAFALNRGLVAAALLNCSLSAVIHSLAWKSSLWRQKYLIAKHRTQYQQGAIINLETAMDTLHESYMHLCKRVEQLEPQTKRLTVPERRGSVMRHVHRTLAKPLKFDSEKSVNSDRPNTFTSYLENSECAVDFQMHCPRSYEMTLNLQKSYTQQLKQTLEETKAEITQYQKLVKTMENGVLEQHQNEREAWTKCVDHLKGVYEQELLRKHAEVIKLHELLSVWTHRYMESQSSPESRQEMCQEFETWSAPSVYRRSPHIEEAIARADKMQLKMALTSTNIEANGGDWSPPAELEDEACGWNSSFSSA